MVHAVSSLNSGGSPGAVGAAPSPMLLTAAHEFEAMMMKELLAPLEQSHDPLTGEDEAGSGNALGSFADEALGRAISARGGFGIADSILSRLSSQAAPPSPGSLPSAGCDLVRFR